LEAPVTPVPTPLANEDVGAQGVSALGLLPNAQPLAGAQGVPVSGLPEAQQLAGGVVDVGAQPLACDAARGGERIAQQETGGGGVTVTPEHFVAPEATEPMAEADRDGDSARPSADGVVDVVGVSVSGLLPMAQPLACDAARGGERIAQQETGGGGVTVTPEHFVVPEAREPMAEADRDGDSARPSADGGGDRCDRDTSTSGQQCVPFRPQVAHHQPLADSGTAFHMLPPNQHFVPSAHTQPWCGIVQPFVPTQPWAGSEAVFNGGAMSTSPGGQQLVAHPQPLAGSGAVFHGGAMSAMSTSPGGQQLVAHPSRWRAVGRSSTGERCRHHQATSSFPWVSRSSSMLECQVVRSELQYPRQSHPSTTYRHLWPSHCHWGLRPRARTDTHRRGRQQASSSSFTWLPRPSRSSSMSECHWRPGVPRIGQVKWERRTRTIMVQPWSESERRRKN